MGTRWCSLLLLPLLLGACFGRAAAPAVSGPAPAPVITVLPAPVAPPPPPTKPVNLVLSAAANVNPGQSDRPSPVMVRIYELKSSVTFDSADFFTLSSKDKEVLAADLLTSDDFQLRPGQRVQISRKLANGVKSIATVVAFRDLERSIWKARLVIGEPPPEEIQILIDARSVQVLAQ